MTIAHERARQSTLAHETRQSTLALETAQDAYAIVEVLCRGRQVLSQEC